jgi:ferredoxin
VAIADRCEAIVKRFAARLISGGTDFSALVDLPQDLLIAPVSLLYYVAGRFVFANSFCASAACNSCGACQARCPVNAIVTVRAARSGRVGVDDGMWRGAHPSRIDRAASWT